MNIVEKIFDAGIGATAKAVGGLAKDIRTAITGKESVTAEERAKIMDMTHELERMSQQLDGDIQKGQVELLKIDAASNSFFQRGPRPFALWCAAIGAVAYPMIQVLLPWGIKVFAFVTGSDLTGFPELPAIDTEQSMVLLGALLGLGAFRSYDKTRKVK